MRPEWHHALKLLHWTTSSIRISHKAPEIAEHYLVHKPPPPNKGKIECETLNQIREILKKTRKDEKKARKRPWDLNWVEEELEKSEAGILLAKEQH